MSKEQDTLIKIRPASGSWSISLGELARYRPLIRSMAAQQVRLKYADLALGFFWAVARPLLMVAVFVLLRNMSQAMFGIEIPYAIYVYSGLILWFYFVEAATSSSSAMRVNAGLSKKIYYPHLINPMVPVLSGLADLAVGFLPLVILMVYYEVIPGPQILFLPVVLGQCMLLAFAVGLLFSALRLNSRDWERFLGLILYVGLFASPVLYSESIIPEHSRVLYHANPMSGTLLAFRASLFEVAPFPLRPFLYSCAFSVVLLVVGVYSFSRGERYLLDRD